MKINVETINFQKRSTIFVPSKSNVVLLRIYCITNVMNYVNKVYTVFSRYGLCLLNLYVKSSLLSPPFLLRSCLAKAKVKINKNKSEGLKRIMEAHNVYT